MFCIQAIHEEEPSLRFIGIGASFQEALTALLISITIEIKQSEAIRNSQEQLKEAYKLIKMVTYIPHEFQIASWHFKYNGKFKEHN